MPENWLSRHGFDLLVKDPKIVEKIIKTINGEFEREDKGLVFLE
jgi:hypothetical protein